MKTLLQDGQALKEDVELILGLGRLARGWSQNVSQVKDFLSATSLVEAVLRDVNDANVEAAFKTLGLEDIRVRFAELLQKAVGSANNVPEAAQKLLTLISRFDETKAVSDPGLITWKLLDKSSAVPVGGAFKLDVGANARLEFEAGDKWPTDDSMPDPLLRIGVRAGFEGKGSVDVPFELGAFAGKAAGSAGVKLDYYFEALGTDTFYGIALAERLPRLPQPFDYDEVWAAFAGDLTGLIYEFDGGASAEASVSLVDAFSLGAGLIGELGATLNVTVSHRAKYLLALRAGPAAVGGGRQIMAALTRTQASAAGLGAALGLSVDISAVAEKVTAVLNNALEVWSKGLKEVQPFLSPGTWLTAQANNLLKTTAENLIGDADLRKALVRDLRGVLGVETDNNPALGDWLVKELMAAVNLSGVVVAAGDRVGTVLERLSERLPAFGESQMREKLTRELAGLPAQLDDELEKVVKSLLASSGAKSALKGALKEARAEVTGLASELDNALAGVRKAIAHFDELLRKIVKDAEAAAKAKVTARLEIEETRSSEATYQFAGTFVSPGVEARGVFEALTRGRFKPLAAVLDGDDPPGFMLDRARSSLRRFGRRQSRFGFEFVLLTLGSTSYSALATGEATSVVDGMGNVVVDAAANFTVTGQGWHEAREASFADVYSLVLARPREGEPPSARQSLQLGISVRHKDKALTRAEATGFVASLEKAKLLQPGSTSRAQAQFDAWTTAAPNAALKADIAAKLWLSPAQALTLLQLSQRTGGALSELAQLRIIQAGLNGLKAAGAARDIAKQLAAAKRRFSSAAPDQMTQAEVILDYKRWYPHLDTFTGPDAAENNQLIADLKLQRRALEELVKVVDVMGDVWEAKPKGATGPGWDEKDYRDAQHDIAGASAYWLRLNSNFLGFSFGDAVDERTVAGLVAFADLAGAQPPSSAMSLVMTNHAADGGAETMALA